MGASDKTVQKWESLFADVDRKHAVQIEAIILDNLYNKFDPATFGVN